MMFAQYADRVLLVSERGREGEFVALCENLLAQRCGARPTSKLEKLEVAATASDVWRFLRCLEDGKDLDEGLKREFGPVERRKNAFRHTDDLVRLRQMLLSSVQLTRKMFRLLQQSTEAYALDVYEDENVVKLFGGTGK